MAAEHSPEDSGTRREGASSPAPSADSAAARWRRRDGAPRTSRQARRSTAPVPATQAPGLTWNETIAVIGYGTQHENPAGSTTVGAPASPAPSSVCTSGP